MWITTKSKALVLGLAVSAGAAATVYVTLDDGTVINVPSWGETCEYHVDYCPRGWLPDGTFPFAEELFKLAEQCDIPHQRVGEPVVHCRAGLVLSTTPCVNEQGYAVDLKTCPNGDFVIGDFPCPDE